MAIILMVLDHRAAPIHAIRSALSIVVVPLQYAVSAPIQWIDQVGRVFSTHQTLIQENQDLKTERLLLKAQVQRLLAVESENNQLKALLNSASQRPGKILIAQLLAVDSDPFVNQIILNKGLRDGVFIGQPVLDADGLMGKIIQVGPISSHVLLISDVHSGVPVQNTRNGVRAIAVGDSYSNKLRLINVSQTSDIKVGDTVVTSGLGEYYPAGYPVGRVMSVVKNPALPFSTIVVELAAHLNRSREVLLVWPPLSSTTKGPAHA